MLSMISVAACSGGGGGGSSTAAVSPPPTPMGPSWTSGVFEPASRFEDQCEVPRSGVDIEGNTFPDQSGTLLEEKFWLRSWTEETYLWNNEVVDRNPSDFTDRLSYFDVLRTTAVTPSGEDKDDFHFSQPTEEFLERRNSTPSASYGVRYAAFSTSPPRDFRIQYTDPDTPASASVAGQVNFIRGARILEVDGIDLINATSQADIDAINAGLFPETAGETHSFLVQDPGAASTRTVTLVSDNLAQKAVNRTEVIDTPTGKVGYILFNTFSPFDSEREIAEAIATMETEGVTDLVVDLRYNGGGLLAVASQLSFMIAGNTRTSGRTFELLQFNANAGSRNPVTGEFNEPIPFYSAGLGFSLANGTPLDSLDLPRVFILSTSDTCSASEAVINGLRGVDVEIVLIGNVTCGKPFGFYPTDNCGQTYYTIQFQGVNAKGFGDYSDGFVPDNSSFGFGERVSGCVVADDYDKELGDESEALLAAALNYRETASCPALPVVSTKPGSSADGSTVTAPSATSLTPREDLLQSNRDMRMPY